MRDTEGFGLVAFIVISNLIILLGAVILLSIYLGA